MQEVHKVTIDLLFCAVFTFLIIHAANSLNKNEQLSNNLSAESARIATEIRSQESPSQ